MSHARSLMGAALLLVAAAQAQGAVPAAAASDGAAAWQRRFAVDRALPAVQLQAHYTDAAGVRHAVQSWRSGGTLRRITDGRLDLLAVRDAEGGYTQDLVDRQRALLVHVSSHNLHRIGVFRNWASLASGIAPPAGDYRVEPVQRAPLQVDGQRCTWWRVAPAHGAAQQVCWSRALGLALAVQPQPGSAVPAYVVDHVHVGAVSASDLHQPTAGLMVVNADDELGPE